LRLLRLRRHLEHPLWDFVALGAIVEIRFLSVIENHAMKEDWIIRADWQAPENALNEGHFAAIGRVIAEWAVLERTIAECVIDLLAGRDVVGDDRRTEITEEILLAGMDTRVTIGLLRAIFRKRKSPQYADELDKLLDKIAMEENRRNIHAHATWHKSRKRPNSIKTSVLKSVGVIDEHEHHFTVSEILRLACRIKERRRQLIAFFVVHVPASEAGG
jgi:hypothetical protein